MSKLQTGDRVRTPWGDGVVVSATYHGMRGRIYDVAIRTEKGDQPMVRVSSWHVDSLEPLLADIPRERVEALHAAVVKRVEQLASEEAHGGGTVRTWLHAELSEVAEALRLLLEVDP